MAWEIRPQFLTANCNICKPPYRFAMCYHTEVPRNLDLDELLKQNPPDFRCNSSLLYYFVSLIYRGNTGNEKIERDYFFTRLNAEYLKHITAEYHQYLNYLEEQNIIVIDPHFINNALSRGYSFIPMYSAQARSITIHDKILVAKLSKPFRKAGKPNIVSTKSLPYLDKWFTPNLKIDYAAVKQHLRCIYQEDLLAKPKYKDLKAYRRKTRVSLAEITKLIAIKRYNARLRPATEIQNSINRTNIDSRVGRMHTPLTTIKKDFRQYISYNGETLVALDLKNSQPYLSRILLKIEKFQTLEISKILFLYNPNLKPLDARSITLTDLITTESNENDVVKFLNWVESGLFYEHFGKQLAITQGITNMDDTELRDYAKKCTYAAFFCKDVVTSWNKVYNLFVSTFPTVAEIFRFIKYGDGYHNTLACTLQYVESQLFLHEICGSIAAKYPEAPIYTIHDSVVTTEAYKNRVKTEIENIIHAKIGVMPIIDEEYWLKKVPVVAP